MKDDSEKFVENQVGQINQKKDVKAVSVNDQYLDSEFQLPELRMFVMIEGNSKKRKTEKVNGAVVERYFFTEEWMRQLLDDPKNDWKVIRFLEKFSNSNISFDPENKIQELIDEAEEIKQKKLDQDIDEDSFIYYIWKTINQIEQCDSVSQRRYLMNDLFDFLLNRKYKMEGKVPVDANQRMTSLKKFDGYMYKLSQEFLMSSSTMEKREKLDQIIDYMTRGMGELGPKSESDRDFLDI